MPTLCHSCYAASFMLKLASNYQACLKQCTTDTQTWGYINAGMEYGLCINQSDCRSQLFDVEKRTCCSEDPALRVASKCAKKVSATLAGVPGQSYLALLKFERSVYAKDMGAAFSFSIQNQISAKYNIKVDQYYLRREGSVYFQGFYLSVKLLQSMKQPVLRVDILDVNQITDLYGLPYNSEAQTHFTLQLPDYTYYESGQIQAAMSTQDISTNISRYLSYLFLVIYLINMGKTIALTYESIIMFSIYRYMNINYPENLNLFFTATDSFKLSISIISSKSQSNQVSSQGVHAVKFSNRIYQLYNQKPNAKFLQYEKSSSFLQNGFSIAVNVVSSQVISLVLLAAGHCFLKILKFIVDRRLQGQTKSSTRNFRPKTLWDRFKLDCMHIFLVLITNICSGLVIKSLCTNMIYFLLAICLQINHLDAVYRINIYSEISTLLSVLSVFVLFGYYQRMAQKAEGSYAVLPRHQRNYHFTRFGEMFIKFNIKNHFFQYFQIYNTVRKVLFTGVIVFFFWHPAACITYIMLQQVTWITLMAINRIQPGALMNILTIFGEIQLLANLCLILKIYLIDLQIQKNDSQVVD